MIYVIDDNYVVISLIICIGWNLLFYLFAAGFKMDKVTDFAYGTNFMLVAIITLLLNQTYTVRQIVVTVLVCVWALRLAGYLLFRILTIGEDKRFDEFREKPLIFLRFWIAQMISVWVISLPEVFLNAKDYDVELNWRDYLGWSMFVVGLVIEGVADQQKFSYKKNHHDHWCDVGLWKLSRHPNYFGEVLLWYGLFTACSSVFLGADWATIIGPTYLWSILMFLSGITRLEESADKRYWNNQEYQKYKKKTSVFVPLPPGLITGTAKKLFCCEFSIYTHPPKNIDSDSQN